MEVEEAEGTESRNRDDKSIRVPEIIKAIPHISLSLSLSLSLSFQFSVLGSGFWVFELWAGSTLKPLVFIAMVYLRVLAGDDDGYI